jgi:hypothetical protein
VSGGKGKRRIIDILTEVDRGLQDGAALVRGICEAFFFATLSVTAAVAIGGAWIATLRDVGSAGPKDWLAIILVTIVALSAALYRFSGLRHL